MSQLVIISPADGILTEWGIPPGRLIQPDQLLGRVQDQSKAWLEVDFLETEAGILKPGVHATARLISGEVLEIRCSEISPDISPEGLLKTWWEAGSGYGLRSGLHASVEAEIVTGQGVYLPRSAVVERSGEPVVFIVRNDTARWRSVRPGWYAEHEVEIKHGVIAGDSVVRSGQFALNEGVPVMVKEKKY